MGFNYNRPKERTKEVQNNNYTPFEPGVYEALIKKVIKGKTQSKKNKFSLICEGEDGESLPYILTFGIKGTEKYLNYLLASIEDHGHDIPDIDFDFNDETLEFIEGKYIYIKVEETVWNEEKRHEITAILSEEEYEAEQFEE